MREGCSPDYIKQLEELVTKEKVVAVGEIGLDYHFKENAPKEVQKAVFEEQVSLAHKVGLPIIVHDRDAHGDTMELLRNGSRRVWCIVFPVAWKWRRNVSGSVCISVLAAR